MSKEIRHIITMLWLNFPKILPVAITVLAAIALLIFWFYYTAE